MYCLKSKHKKYVVFSHPVVTDDSRGSLFHAIPTSTQIITLLASHKHPGNNIYYITICDRISENMPNCGFHNSMLAGVFVGIHNFINIAFLGSYKLRPLISHLGNYGMSTPFRLLLTAVKIHLLRTRYTQKRSETLTLYGNNRIMYGLT